MRGKGREKRGERGEERDLWSPGEGKQKPCMFLSSAFKGFVGAERRFVIFILRRGELKVQGLREPVNE